VIALLLADPFLVHSVGFALSVGASAGIACLGPPIAARLPGPRWVREPLAVTLAAQVGVAPVLLPVFGSIPAVAPLANLLAVPAAEPLSVYGMAASGVLAVAAPLRPLAGIVHLPTTLLLRWVNGVAARAAGVPLAVHMRGALGLVALVAAVTALRKAGATLRGDVPPEPNAIASRARE
jgi:competence protein ComEC